MNKLLLFTGAFMLSLASFADTDGSSESEKQLYDQGVEAFESGDYKQARSHFESLIGLDENNAEYYFLAGLSIYQAETDLDGALDYMTESINHFSGDTIAEVYLYLGRGYRESERLEEAKEAYETFQTLLKDNAVGKELGERVSLELQWVNSATKMQGAMTLATQGTIVIENLGSGVNTEYGDYAPVQVIDGQLAYTSRRPNGNERKAFDGKYYEDIYFARKDEQGWRTLEDGDGSVIYDNYNTHGHDAFIASVSDGNTIYIYRKNEIYESKFDNGTWSDLVQVEDINNNSNHTPSVTLTPDGTIMYFAHEEKDGFGGKDLYKTSLNEAGKWTKPVNMGSVVNTPYTEEAPFLTSDGNTLYFSSEGHGSYGGFDFLNWT